jgi:hypothetical protein
MSGPSQGAIDKFMRVYNSEPQNKHLRIGQFFINIYVKDCNGSAA